MSPAQPAERQGSIDPLDHALVACPTVSAEPEGKMQAEQPQQGERGQPSQSPFQTCYSSCPCSS